MEKNKPTETQIQILMSDWLGNLRQKDEGNYTHRGSGGIRTKTQKSFSEYILEDLNGMDDLELIKQSRMAAEEVVNAVVSEPAVVTVGDYDSMHGKIDGRHVIQLATDFFDDRSLTKRDKVDIFLGLASHEAAHGAFTESDDILERLGSEKPEFMELKKNIWNIIEDERIEYHLGEERPGLVGSLSATKAYYFKKLIERLRADGKEPTEPLPKLIAALTQAIRYPSQMTRDQVEENFDELDQIRKILTPYPLTPEAAWTATDRVMDVVRDMAKKQAEEQKNQQQQQQQGQPSSQGGGGQQGQQGRSGNDPSSQQAQSGNGQGKQKKDDKKSNGQQPSVKSPTQKEIEQALRDMLGTNEAKKVMDAIKKDNDKSNSENASGQLYGDEQTQYVNENDSECEGGGAGSGIPKTFIFKPAGSQDNYLQAKRNVRAYIPAMSKALSCKGADSDYQLRGLPSGRLNTNKLATLKMGNKNIFDKRGTVTCSKASVVMLIDESCSMSGERLHAAREAAILVNEAIARIPSVNFYCYGYTSGKINVYSENGKTAKYALGGTVADNGTPTGDAMKITSERVRKITKEPCLMLVLTDGVPDSASKVIEQDRVLKTKGFIPVGVGIQSNAVSRTFSEYVVVDDISSFAFDLGRLTRGKLDRLMQRHEEE